LVAFWQSLPRAVVTGRLFTLPDNAHILGRVELGDSIYIRPSYETVYAKLMEVLGKVHRKGVVVVGTPGIGKSMFACYLLYRLQIAYPASSFVYIDFKKPNQRCMVFSPQGVRQSMEVSQDVTDSPQNFLIFDMGGKEPQSVPSSYLGAQVIVLSSANSAHFDTFLREFKNMLVMKTWSKDEIDEARALMYNGPELNDYRERYRDLGGVPRWVFDRDHSHAELVTQFRGEMPSADDVIKLLELKDFTKINIDKGARLITYEVDTDLHVTQIRWVSDRIGQRTMEILTHASERRTSDLLRQLSENPAAGGAFGIAFEVFAHLKLAEGGPFDIRPLQGGAPQKLMLKASKETVYFDESKDVPDKVYMRHTL
jgi:hypothetical protein